VAFPQTRLPELIGAYFEFCKSYYKQHRYRGNVVSGAARLHQDRGSLLAQAIRTDVHPGASSSGEQGWDDF